MEEQPVQRCSEVRVRVPAAEELQEEHVCQTARPAHQLGFCEVSLRIQFPRQSGRSMVK